MSDYGRSVIGVVGRSVQLIASDFQDVIWKAGGITIDWDLYTALVAPVTLTGGTTIAAGEKYIPIGSVVLENDDGYYGPYDAAAEDGRDALARGKCYLVNEDWTENTPLGLVQGAASDHPGVFNAGTVYKARLKVGGAGQPSWEMFEAAFPMINYVEGLNTPSEVIG